MTSLASQNTDIDCISLDRKNTFYLDPFIREFLFGNNLTDHYSLYPNKENILKQIKAREDFDQNKRNVLVQSLKEQYKGYEGKVQSQIELLQKENTFTITTGQQIHVGLGPLYVLYKILNVIKISNELSAAYPDYHFVPLFWMASEDHDLEEIRDVKIFNKSVTWQTDQKGAVGRMSNNGISEIFEEIKANFNLDSAQLVFIERALAAYKLPDLSSATRKLINDYFGKDGLVCLDADNKNLKSSFKEISRQEILGTLSSAHDTSSEALKNKGFENQIHIRDINLFWLGSGGRTKMEWEGNNLIAGNDILCVRGSLDSWLDQNMVNVSPNVALRPLYQELILPNLLYVGGSSEVKYWFQVTSIFKACNLPYPILFLRTSAVFIPKKALKQISEISLSQMYTSEDSLVSSANSEINKLDSEINAKIQRMILDLQAFEDLYESNFKGFNISGKTKKIFPKLTELEELTKDRLVELAGHNPALEHILKVKNKYFNEEDVQERTVHIIEYINQVDKLLKTETSFNMANLLTINHLVL